MKINSLIDALVLSCFIIMLCCAPAAAQAVGPEAQNQLSAMQDVIDKQQSEINQQKQAFETQQQELADQRQKSSDQQKMLETLQSQMQSLLAGQDSEHDVISTADVIVSGDDQSGITASSVADETVSRKSSSAKTSTGILHAGGANERPNQHEVALVSAPLDIPDDTGLFIFSNDDHKMIRLYGSMRMLSIIDNRRNFHPYDLNIPQVPVGADNIRDVNSNWSIKTSRLGLDIDVRDLMSLKAEFDWKGDGSESLRIRHMYMRTNHWLVGQHWNALNTVPFLPQSIDSHSTSAHVGARPVQFKYMGESNKLELRVFTGIFSAKSRGT